MLKQSDNILHRLFSRQTCRAAPNTHEEILFQRQAVAQEVKALPSDVGFSLPFNLHEPKGKALLSHSISRDVNPVANAAYDDQTNIIQGGDKSLGADIDIQYDGYFGGLFESLEMSGGSQNESFVERCSAESSSELKSSFSPTRLETPSNCHVNRGMAALSSDNQAESMPSATDGRNIGVQIGTSRCSSFPGRTFAVEYEGNFIVGRESGNLGIAEPIGVSFPSSSTNMASSIGKESNFRDLSVFGESTSQGEPGGASASVHSSERNVMQYILSSRSLGSQQHHGSVEEVMPSGSYPVAFSSLAGYDRFVNLSAIQRQIGEASAFERLSSYVEAAEATPSAIGLESTHRGIILSDLGSTGSPRRTDDRANDMVTAAPISTANATWQIDTPHSQQRSHVWENVSNLPVREEHASERAFQELDGQGNQLLGGIKQRLLSFLFQSIWNQDVNPVIKTQQLKRFYYHFQHYAELVMWKVQFLDRYHLLIKFGSIDGVVSQNSDISHQTSFLAIYNMETTEILDFQQNSSKVLLRLFEHFCDHFRVLPRLPLLMNYITSHSNNVFSREQLQKQKSAYAKNKSRSSAQVISATDRHKPCMENAIKFMSRQKPNLLKFKINPGHFNLCCLAPVTNINILICISGITLFV
ncbi:hypothetical protein O6H91_03G057500 [Diphasiastrum complanatum]|uniref:Uncharacterized protein n=1 Tax=Diphasiastrum complanatum TaxID=34168 RepID=A0ACC2E6P5_DIPCM|nr:hypothetical protein O6H91_03G057500 [Diphasiastrum complanatum]